MNFNVISMRLQAISICLALTAFFTTIANAQVPDDARKYSGNHYKIFKQIGISWAEAKTQCKKLGGQLVVIESRSESRFVHRLIENHDSDTWIGIASDKDGKPAWVNGAKFDKELLEKYDRKQFFKQSQYGIIDKNGEFDNRLSAGVRRVDYFLCEWEAS